MNADPQLRDRLRAADDAVRFDVEASLTAARRGVEARDRRRRVETLVLVAAIVGLLVFAGWRASIRERTNVVPVEPPTGSVVPRSDRTMIRPPPTGVLAELTVSDVETFVIDQIAADEATLGGSVAPARIISVTYVSPGSRGASWIVTYEGTRLNCTSWCSVHPGGTIRFSDKGPHALGGAEVLEEMVCVAHLPGFLRPPAWTAKYPPCEQIMTVRP